MNKLDPNQFNPDYLDFNSGVEAGRALEREAIRKARQKTHCGILPIGEPLGCEIGFCDSCGHQPGLEARQAVCPDCGGKGYLTRTSGEYGLSVDCPECDGTGN